MNFVSNFKLVKLFSNVFNNKVKQGEHIFSIFEKSLTSF